MVPAYMSRHPPDPNYLASSTIPALGPPLRDPTIPKPVPDMSREFYLNVVDTQNAMLDYAIAYDVVSEALVDLSYFIGDESRSSLVYTILLVSGSSVLIFGPYIYQAIPWNLIFLLAGWAIMGTSYKYRYYSKEEIEIEGSNAYKGVLKTLDRLSVNEFAQSDAPEEREVEVFELQKYDVDVGQWKKSFWSDDPYTISVSRQNISHPAGQSSLMDIKAPKNWEFISDEWQLDYCPEVWINQRCFHWVTDIDNNEKWVYDCIDGHRSMTWRRRRWTRICGRTSD